MPKPSEAAMVYLGILIDREQPTWEQTRALIEDWSNVTPAQFSAILTAIQIRFNEGKLKQ